MDDDEIFKICTEYWNFLADDLYHKEVQMQRPMAALMLSPTPVAQSPRLQTYSPILAQARRILIDRMPKPEVPPPNLCVAGCVGDGSRGCVTQEVLVVEDENGEVVKEHLKDVEVRTALPSSSPSCRAWQHRPLRSLRTGRFGGQAPQPRIDLAPSLPPTPRPPPPSAVVARVLDSPSPAGRARWWRCTRRCGRRWCSSRTSTTSRRRRL